MDTSLNDLFNDILQDIRQFLDAHDHGGVPDSTAAEPALRNKPIPIAFHLDGNGNYHFEAEKYGAGKKVHFCARIADPNAVYSVTVRSSAGGGGHWDNIHPNEPMCGELLTSIFKKTKLTVDIHANVRNVDGHAVIDVTY